MFNSNILIPSNSTGKSVGSSPSLAEAAVVSSPTAILDLAIKSDLEVEPSEAPPSPNYVPSYHIYAPASPDYYPGPDTESEPFEDKFEPIEDDAPEAAKPLPAQVTPLPLQITPTSPIEPTPTPYIIPCGI
nr:hypothetical protein [Tanacetum cinerariifolium]